MNSPCKIGDTIRTVRRQSEGTFEGSHLYCTLNNQESCDMGDEFIANGKWELFEGKLENESPGTPNIL